MKSIWGLISSVLDEGAGILELMHLSGNSRRSTRFSRRHSRLLREKDWWGRSLLSMRGMPSRTISGESGGRIRGEYLYLTKDRNTSWRMPGSNRPPKNGRAETRRCNTPHIMRRPKASSWEWKGLQPRSRASQAKERRIRARHQEYYTAKSNCLKGWRTAIRSKKKRMAWTPSATMSHLCSLEVVLSWFQRAKSRAWPQTTKHTH